MTYHALVVDDNPTILEDVEDRLESLGHTCEVAETQVEARKLLAKGKFSYALLDLEIPVRYGSLCRVDNGENLVREIRTTRGFEDALRAAHRDRAGAKSHSQLVDDPEPPQPFEQGEMVFRETRVELCGVRICDGVGSGLMRAILDVLRQRDARGRFIALSGEELAQRAGHGMTRQNDIADAVRRLRLRIEKVLRERAHVQCGRQDVIINDRKYSYCLSPKITLRDPDDVRNAPNHGGNDVRNDVKHDVTNGQNDPRNSPGDVKDLSARQQWILDELAARGAMQKDELQQGYHGQFRLSKTTLERDLKTLRSRNLIRFEGEKRDRPLATLMIHRTTSDSHKFGSPNDMRLRRLEEWCGNLW